MCDDLIETYNLLLQNSYTESPGFRSIELQTCCQVVETQVGSINSTRESRNAKVFSLGHSTNFFPVSNTQTVAVNFPLHHFDAPTIAAMPLALIVFVTEDLGVRLTEAKIKANQAFH